MEAEIQSQSQNEIQNNNNNNIEQLQYNYFASSNILSRHIVSEQKALMKHLEGTWNELDSKRRDALLDLLFVDDDVRERYSVTGNVGNRKSSDDIPESFPTLYIDSGQKIHVDYENDLWTWRDEHSGPFSWMSRSQQDLTLGDLEPENISKPQPKIAKGDIDANKNKNTAEEQFSYPVNSWSRDIIDGYLKHEKDIVISPSSSEYFTSKNENDYEKEINTAAQDQSDPSVLEEATKGTGSDSSSQEIKADVKERRRRSPSPKKIKRSSSLRRSPSKASDQGEQKLIANKNDDAYEERNTFSNPVMETEWSNFIGNETDAAFPNDTKTRALSPNEPEIQIMDRGRDVPGSSPYQGDRVQLISPTDSPSQASGISAHLASPGISSCSVESTPDHSTHLLKGMQKHEEPSVLYQDTKHISQDQASNFDIEDEVLTVETDGEKLNIYTETETKTKSEDNIPTTGFDFLDNW